ncbi:unnamed protein product [Strongylus vulgaris]|uniref:Uncharacterized protein n=1 Tax=Strongylus vulgaris TaxID=40348 RepID=A0A3P7ICT9_STRVU|nr:unnamed protein product [Strongylus vulgaris]
MGKTRATPSRNSTASALAGGSSKSAQRGRIKGITKGNESTQEISPQIDVKPPTQYFKYTNEECLKRYSTLTSVEQFDTSYPGNLKEKLIRGALKANRGSLPCFLCQKFLSTSLGLALHIRKCRAQASDSQQDEDSPSKPRLQLKKQTHASEVEISSLEQLKEEPSLWLRIDDIKKLDVLKRLFTNERKIECFAIPKEGRKCPILTSYEAAIKHLDSCVLPMYLTFIGERASLFRKLDTKLQTRYIREAMNLKLELPCLVCGRMFAHHYGLRYHVERCNVPEEVGIAFG